MKKILLIFLSVFAFVSVYADITWTLSDDGTLTISGTDMRNYSEGGSPWYSQRSEIKKVEIKEGVTVIGNNAFYGCSNLSSISIPNSVTNIGNQVFYKCSGLSSIIIPNSVTSIGVRGFFYCYSLTSINIPDRVTNISLQTFEGCRSLTSITIPNSVVNIRSSAFAYCSGLTSITIPNSVTSIESSAFSACSDLASVTIGNSVTSIEAAAFSDCSKLTSVTIGNSVTNIGKNVFNGCNIQKIEINSSALLEKDYDENNYHWLIYSTFGENVKECIIGSEVKKIGNYTFSGCSNLTSVTIPNTVKSIGERAFNGCSGLTSITIPNSVTSIGSSAFKACSKLTSITIPNSVTSVGGGTFHSCSSLTSVTIGNSVVSIGEYAFDGCNGLRCIYSWNIEPPYANLAFSGVNRNHTKVFVPEGTGDTYRYATGWKDIVNIYEMEYTTLLPPSNPTSITDVSPTVTNGYYKENTVSYIRESSAISEDNYASFCLPFAVDATDAQFKAVYVPVGLALYNGEANTLRIGFYKTNEILPAGTPFLAKLAVNDKVEVKNALPINYSDKTPDVKNSVIRIFDYSENSGIMNNNTSFDINFSGTYTRISPANANTFNTDGSVGPSASVVPFRAYIDLAKNSSNAKILSLFNEESETTGIKLVERIVSDAAAYNLAGQRISPLKAKGVMIINGKKYVK